MSGKAKKSMSGDTLKGKLLRAREIKITVTGRKSGRPISNPVWFVLEGEKLYLVPVNGADTQWYKNVLKNPSVQIEAGGLKAEVRVRPIADEKKVAEVVEKFREKYGASDIKEYYAKLDVALEADLT
jgi:deazaflavin-dependent oxidoreductase (nitroreductase family)